MSETRRVKSSEIRVGDIVCEHGMRVRIDAINVHEGQGSSGLDVFCCQGTVLNLAEVLEAKFVPASFLTTEKWVDGKGWQIDRRDSWVVQGNDLATWTVEQPEPALTTNSWHIAWSRLTAQVSDHAARQLLATAVAKGEAADRCNRITYSTTEGIYRIYAQA